MLKEQEERREEAGELLSEAAINVVPHARRKWNKEERIAAIKVRIIFIVVVIIIVVVIVVVVLNVIGA